MSEVRAVAGPWGDTIATGIARWWEADTTRRRNSAIALKKSESADVSSRRLWAERSGPSQSRREARLFAQLQIQRLAANSSLSFGLKPPNPRYEFFYHPFREFYLVAGAGLSWTLYKVG